MKRKHKSYSRPKRPFDKGRIEEEAQIKKDFGLKNKKEIWKAEAKINSMRVRAKKLIKAEDKVKQAFFDKLNKIGLNVNSLADVLSLDKKDYLGRRLETVVFNKKLVTTIKTARQMITHKKVLVDGKVVSSPSYIVPLALESKIKLKESKKPIKPKKEKPVEKVEEDAAEETEESTEEQNE